VLIIAQRPGGGTDSEITDQVAGALGGKSVSRRRAAKKKEKKKAARSLSVALQMGPVLELFGLFPAQRGDHFSKVIASAERFGGDSGVFLVRARMRRPSLCKKLEGERRYDLRSVVRVFSPVCVWARDENGAATALPEGLDTK
jgi:hypothetical protein